MAEVNEKIRDPEVASFPVDLEATVNFWHPNRHKLFVQEGDTGVYVKLSHEQYLSGPALRAGSRIRILGDLDTQACFLKGTSIRLVRDETPIVPKKIDLAKTRKGLHWSSRVEFTGTVLSQLQIRDVTQLVLESDGVMADCFVNGQVDQVVLPFVGAKVLVRGAMDWAMHDSGAPKRARCHLMKLDDLEFLSDAATVPVPKMLNSLEEVDACDDGTHISARGLVNYVSRGHSFLLEDKNGTLLVDYSGDDLICVGTTLKVEGVLEKDSFGSRLKLLRGQGLKERMTGAEPLKTDAKAIATENINHRRVTVTGKLDDHFSRGSERVLLLTNRGIAFEVGFRATDEEVARLALQEGQLVQCQGFVSRQADVGWFRVDVDSVDRIWPQIQDGFHIDAREATWWLAGFFMMIAACGVWLSTLRQQVRKKTQHLAKLTARLDASYEAIDEGIVVAGSDGRVASVNTRFNELAQVSLTAGDQSDLVWEALGERFRQRDGSSLEGSVLGKKKGTSKVAKLELRTAEEPFCRLAASVAPVYDSEGMEIATLLTLKDITKQQELEAQLVQAQKMEAVGQLAGGVAHDFNNLLTVIVSNLELAKLEANDSEVELVDNLTNAQLASGRAAELVKSLLGFSRLSTLELRTTSLNEIVENVSSLLRRSFESTILIRTDLDPKLWNARVDRSQMEQVLMNACVNARDAMHDHVGELVISTSNVGEHGEEAVLLSVADDGAGMSETVRKRVFEPFFTTKPTGEGTGLGMSMSYGIVTQHNGRIECVSSPGEGTRIDITLPRCNNDPGGTEVAIAGDGAEEPLTRKLSARVLLVDDEDTVRMATARMLTKFGLSVTDVDNGYDALAIAQDQDFDLVLLDLNMPNLSGRDVFRQLSVEQPTLPVVIYTGYVTDAQSMWADIGCKPFAILRKPFRFNELREAVSEALVCKT